MATLRRLRTLDISRNSFGEITIWLQKFEQTPRKGEHVELDRRAGTYVVLEVQNDHRSSFMVKVRWIESK